MATDPGLVAPSGRRGAGPSLASTGRDEGDPFDVGAELGAARLEDLFTQRGDWVELVRHHGERAEATLDPAERAQALCRAAVVCRTRLGDGDAARAALGRAFAACPEDEQVAGELEAAAGESAAAAAEVRALYARTAAECELGAPPLTGQLWLRVALLDVTVRHDPAGAVDALGRVSEPVSTRSAALFERIARHAPSCEVLDALASLCRRTGDGAREKQVLLRSLERASDVCDRAGRHDAIAALLSAEGDEEGAAWYRSEALRLDPSRSVALAAIAGDRAGSAAGDPEPARFRVAPEPAGHDGATSALADRYWREKRWHELEPLLELLLRSDAPSGPARQGPHDDSRADFDQDPARGARSDALPRVELWYRAGCVSLQLGKYESARHLFGETLLVDPSHLPALIGQALVLAELGRWDEAHELYGAALPLQRSLGRPAAELAETLCRMGEMRDKGGQPEAALTLYQSALDLHPAHRRALHGACRLHREAGDLRAVERLLRAALPHASHRRRADLLLDLAGLVSRWFGNPGAAVALTHQALAIAPGERRPLLALVEHCQAAGHWREAVDALGQLAEQEGSVFRRGRLYQMAADLARNLSVDEAATYLESSLDCFFGGVMQPPDAVRTGCFRAFRDLDALLRAREDWKRLERAYCEMIRRLGAGAPELPQLWEGLGFLYREQLGHPVSAMKSFEVASELEGGRLTHDRILIDLYQSAAPDELDKLIERRRRLLAAEPWNAEHYSALRSLFVKSKDRDGTFCACRALVFLDRADRQEDEFYRRNRPERIVWPGRPLAGRDWRRLRHADEDPLVAAVLALAAERVALSRATTARRLRLRDDTSAVFEHVRHLFRSTSMALGVTEPALFVMPGVDEDMVLANLRRGSALMPAFVIGRLMYQGRSNAQMVHTMTRVLTYTRPHAYQRLLLGPSSRVAAAFAAACAVGGGLSDGAAADDAIELGGAIRRRAGRAWLAELRGAVRRLRERGEQVDVGRFCRALDATARRAALLFGGAIDVAADDLSREPMFARRRPRDERLADLLIHSVSDEHFGLRRDLGLALE